MQRNNLDQLLTVRQESVKGDGETANFTLFYRDGRALIERSSISLDGQSEKMQVSCIYPIDDRTHLIDFFTSDSCADVARQTFSRLLQAYDALSLNADRPPVDRAAMTRISRLSECKNEAELFFEVRSIVRSLGGMLYFFTVVQLDEQTGHPSNYRSLIDGPIRPFQIYQRKKWFASKPFLLHASSASEVLVGSQLRFLQNLSGNWRDMALMARQWGVGSWLSCPAHTGRAYQYGVLRVCSSVLPRFGGEDVLLKESPLFRALAAELLEWVLKHTRERVLRESSLSEQELLILHAMARSSNADNLAREVAVSKRDLYQRIFPEISRKMGTRNISDAVRYALRCGLVKALPGRKVVFVVHSERWGVYLGRREAAPFWSRINPDPELGAVAFIRSQDATDFISEIRGGEDYRVIRLEVDQSATEVPMLACVEAGIPAWENAPINSGASPDDSATPGVLDEPSTCYH
jgi:hypothetical protein